MQEFKAGDTVLCDQDECRIVMTYTDYVKGERIPMVRLAWATSRFNTRAEFCTMLRPFVPAYMSEDDCRGYLPGNGWEA